MPDNQLPLGLHGLWNRRDVLRVGSVSIAAGLVAYLLSALAALKLVKGEAAVAVAAVIAALFTLWAEWGLGIEAMLYGALLIGIGLALYPLVRTAKSSG